MTNAEAAASLPTDERQALTLRKIYGYRSCDIAMILHISPLQADALLAKAARHFADALEPR